MVALCRAITVHIWLINILWYEYTTLYNILYSLNVCEMRASNSNSIGLMACMMLVCPVCVLCAYPNSSRRQFHLRQGCSEQRAYCVRRPDEVWSNWNVISNVFQMLFVGCIIYTDAADNNGIDCTTEWAAASA